jgi:hypothetical protein
MNVLLEPIYAILCICQGIAMSMLAIGQMLVNGIIVAIGGFVDVISALLPNMPAAVGPPNSAVLGWILWIYPLGTALGVLSAVITVWIALLGIRIALRWVKAL